MTGGRNNVAVTSARVAGLVALMGQQAKVVDELRSLQIDAVSVDLSWAKVVVQPMLSKAEEALARMGEALSIAEEWAVQAREQASYLASLDAEGLRVYVDGARS